MRFIPLLSTAIPTKDGEVVVSTEFGALMITQLDHIMISDVKSQVIQPNRAYLLRVIGLDDEGRMTLGQNFEVLGENLIKWNWIR